MQYQNPDELRLARTRSWGLPDGVGRSMIMEGDGTGAYHNAIRQRFGHVLSGGLKNKLDGMDEHESTLFGMQTPSRINANDEYGNGGRERAAIGTKNNLPSNDRRNRRAMTPQTKVSDSKYSVNLENFEAPMSNELAQAEALFGGGRAPRGSYSETGPLLPDRGHNTTMDLGGYGAVPFDPRSILNKVPMRQRASGIDYRELESNFGHSDIDESEGRYLNNVSYRNQGQGGTDPQIMQEMARTMADQMLRTFMNENKGKQYFKEIKTTHKFDDPKSKLVEIDGKYYKMDLTQVRFKKGKSTNKQ